MYATCLFCNSALGANESIEHFPVGRRLAFDSATGRLWVVCRKCERWNLSPLETRWEAIEEAERAFRGTKLRVSTDNIGLARLREGTELVRIGKPLRPEFAAWRYGDQFGKRQRSFMTKTILASGAFGAAPYVLGGGQRIMDFVSAGPISGVYVFIGGAIIGAGVTSLSATSVWRHHRKPLATVRGNNGELLRLSKLNVYTACISPAGHAFDWQVKLEHLATAPAGPLARAIGIKESVYTVATPALLRHDAALNALATILPHSNRAGGGKRAVKAAVDLLGDAPGAQYLMHLAANTKSNRQPKSMSGEILLGLLPSILRLALEMSLHEDDERRAMEGELKELEQRWRDADAIAKIADGMFLPESVDEQVRAYDTLFKFRHAENESGPNE